MSTTTKKVEVRIDGKTYSNDSIFPGMRLSQKTQEPNMFHFLIRKETVAEDGNDIRFSMSEELLGKTVELFLTISRDDERGQTHDETLEFTGIIFSINSLRQDIKEGLMIEVTAYSPDHLLFDNPHCYSYENETLKNIITRTLEPYNIPIQNNPRMEDEIPYTVQYNETNYAFINRLASRFGEWLYYSGKELVFGKIKKSDCIELEPSYDLLDYQYQLQMEHLNFSHAHHNYLEYGNTRNDAPAFTGQSMHNMTDITYKRSQSIYSKETFGYLKSSVAEGSFDETELSAKVQGLGRKAQMMVCMGRTSRADLRIGSIIKIKEYTKTDNQKTGSCYHDELLICEIVHTSDRYGNYINEFMAIPAGCEYPPYIPGDYYPKAGSQRAVVKENQDPEQLGRVRVQFLWQQEQDDSLLTPWIRIAQPHGGGDKGFYFVPEIGEEVMVGFENGNAEKPYITGTLYHGNQRPESKWHNENNDIKAIRTRNGHTVEIHDAGEGGFIKIYDHEKENYVLTFSTDEKLIKLESTGNIEFHAEKDIIMKAGNNIDMKAEKDMNREAGGNIKETAGKNISTKAEEDILIHAVNDMDTKVGNNDTLNVKNNQVIEISSDKNETVTKKYQLKAENIWKEASDKMSLYSKDHDQQAKSSMKVDGGNGLDLKANNIKIS